MGLALQPLHTEAGPQSLTRLQKEAGGLPWDQIRGGLRLGDCETGCWGSRVLVAALPPPC